MRAIEPRFGMSLYPTQPIGELVESAKEAERAGISTLWVGDSQNIWREPFATMGAIAQATSAIRIATGVSNLVTRHPTTVAAGFASLQEFAPGRVVAGLGTGDSSLATIGRKPMRAKELEDAMKSFRRLVSGLPANLSDSPHQVRLTYASGRTAVPIYLAASGPKMLDLAGRVADGVVLLAGAHSDAIERSLDRVVQGERAAGRVPGTVKRVLWLPVSVDEDSSVARRSVRAHVARTALRPHPVGLPARLSAEIAELRRNYDYYQHMSTAAHHAQDISAELVERFAVAGNPFEVAKKLAELCRLPIDEIAFVPFAATESLRVPVAVKCIELAESGARTSPRR